MFTICILGTTLKLSRPVVFLTNMQYPNSSSIYRSTNQLLGSCQTLNKNTERGLRMSLKPLENLTPFITDSHCKDFMKIISIDQLTLQQTLQG